MFINTRLALIVSLVPFVIAAAPSDINTLAKRNTCAFQSAHYAIQSNDILFFTDHTFIDQKGITVTTEQDPALKTRMDLFATFFSGIPAGTLAWVRLHLYYAYSQTF